ncbi:MAG: hypothetical protein K2K86_08535, partial [Muribaculaceae bacterium]|nr:hypothetical protein [Muribaculaceae bacterium]
MDQSIGSQTLGPLRLTGWPTHSESHHRHRQSRQFQNLTDFRCCVGLRAHINKKKNGKFSESVELLRENHCIEQSGSEALE